VFARRLRLAIGVVALLAVLAGCQVDLHVDVQVNKDGSGSVIVAAGLDDDALARVGNLQQQLRVDDLEAAGWAVTAPSRDGDRTWVRASKSFSTPEEGTAVLSELSGPQGPFRDFVVKVDDGAFGTDYSVHGVVDLTGGPAAFGDQELSALLGGDPYGGTLAAIERDEGRPVSDMVDFQVNVSLPGDGSPTVYTPSFADDQATQVSASSSQRSNAATLAIWGLVASVGVIGLVVLRQGFKRVNR
jgi:hypothetical protein